MSHKKAFQAIAITMLTTALLFTACGAMSPLYTHATITVRYVHAR
ncbi:MAG: hypothetical protein KatS3mg053_3474 [Candidatus Roseilinea sp.]|jgi:predicted small lipoprotein YifL|nr:MAG: hypothetical protein KatS3mg053_3474 [Candidatus Roseilinea sp.]